MAEVALDAAARRRLKSLIVRFGAVDGKLDRLNLLDNAGLLADDVGVVGKLSLEVGADAFAGQLIRELEQRGDLESTRQPALVGLLRELRETVRGHHEEAAFLDGLLAPYRPASASADVPVDAIAGETAAERPLRIFLSYRRKSWAFTRSLADELRQRLGAEVFVDLDGIKEDDFERSILSSLHRSDVVVLVVSEYTFDERIQRPGDWVRREIAEALALSKPLVLAMVDGRTPPDAAELPEDIRAVTRRQGVPFPAEYWTAAVERLVGFIREMPMGDDAAPMEAASPPAARSRPDGLAVPPGLPDKKPTLEAALAAIDVDNDEEALFHLDALIAAGFTSRTLNLGSLRDDALARIDVRRQREEAEREYALIAALVGRPVTRSRGLEAWREFQGAYPDYHDDPQDIGRAAEKEAAIPAASNIGAAAPGAVAADQRAPVRTPSTAQQAQLDIMLDPHQSPKKRTEAGRRLAELGDPRPGVGLRADGLPDFAWSATVEPGTVKIDDGIGERRVGRPFHLALYPVTYAQYQSFLATDEGYADRRWWEQPIKLALRQDKPGSQTWPIANHPAENVSWYDAMAFCRWVTHRLSKARDSHLAHGFEIRLPTEAEWQLAAGGPLAQEYPWGPDYQVGRANVDESKLDGGTYLEQTTAVGIYPNGKAACGALDLSGNVWEWPLSEGGNGSHSDMTNDQPRVLRGGSWFFYPVSARASARGLHPLNRGGAIGFRVILAAPVP